MTDAESLQQAIHQEVALQAYDPAWPGLFEGERERLRALFPQPWPGLEHFGSTAVVGVPAKPVIDILAGVESMVTADALTARLLESGYTTSAGFNATLTDRRWFMRWADGRRTHHLHVVVHGASEWHRRLYFRDALRADPALATRYALLKQRLAAAHRADREAYTQAKLLLFSRCWPPPETQPQSRLGSEAFKAADQRGCVRSLPFPAVCTQRRRAAQAADTRCACRVANADAAAVGWSEKLVGQ